MINRELIIENIEKFINGETDDFCPVYNGDVNVVNSALENIVVRLINTYRKYTTGTPRRAKNICANAQELKISADMKGSFKKNVVPEKAAGSIERGRHRRCRQPA